MRLSCLLLISTLFTLSCNAEPLSPISSPSSSKKENKPAHTASKTDLNQIYQELLSLKPGTPCSKHDHCTALPIGKKACGGPSGYIALSTLSTHKARAEKLSQDHQALSRETLINNGISSDCSIISPPAYQCVAKQCIAQ